MSLLMTVLQQATPNLKWSKSPTKTKAELERSTEER